MHAVLVLLLLAAQEDQTPRPPVKNSRGLLQVNRDYYDIAAATGGDFYFWAAGEFATSNLQIPIEHDEVLLSYGTTETKRVFDIPVESGVRSLEVFAGIQRKDLAVLIRPDGTVVREHDAGTNVQSFQHMLIVTVKSPAAGTWRLELHGTGIHCVTAHVQPSEDGPQLGTFDQEKCALELDGTASKVQLEFVTRDSTLISRPTPGRCILPDVPYRVAVTGVDVNGKPFRRVERALRKP